MLPVRQHSLDLWNDIAKDKISSYAYSGEPRSPKLYTVTFIEQANNWIDIAPLPDHKATTAPGVKAQVQVEECVLCQTKRIVIGYK